MYAIVAVDLSARQRLGMLARDVESAVEASGPLSDNPLFRTYHYAIPPELSEQLLPGQMVWVPFGNDQRQGLLLGFDDHAPVAQVRPLRAIVQAQPFLQSYQLDLARWMSQRYLAPLWDTLLLLLPPGVMQQTERVLRRDPRATLMPLTREARRVLAWVEGQGGESTQKQVGEVLGSEAAARRAVSELLKANLLRVDIVAKPPGVRPRMERFVTLLGDEETRHARFRGLGRASKKAALLERVAEQGGEMPLAALLAQAETNEAPVAALVEQGLLAWVSGSFVQRQWPDEPVPLTATEEAALSWLDSWPEEEPLPVRTMQAAGIAARTLHTLAGKGCLALHTLAPERIRLLVPPARLESLLDELRGSGVYRTVLNFLRRHPTEMTVGEIYAATEATRRHLDGLVTHGLISIERREVLRNPLAARTFTPTVPPLLTPEQAAVWEEVARALNPPGGEARAGKVFLLHGVTGSGKTEIYLRAVAETLAQGKQAIILVPEISLTPQTIARFGSRFGEQIALQHSQLSQGERYDEWRRLRDGRAQIAIGSRSALFAPVPNLGLIVLDEEHEWTYKQGHLPGYRFPHYHARDVAAKLAELTGATVLLGSATPAIESYHRAERGRYHLLEMGQRVVAHLRVAERASRDDYPPEDDAPPAIPPVQIVDMRQELRVGNTSIFSRDLRRAVEETLAAGQQTILFLNRRGSHSFVMCRDCGWVQECVNCDAPMTFHRGLPYLICHQCSATVPIPTFCPQCFSPRVKQFGVGTQQVEVVAQQLFPDARLLRWDRDTTQEKGAHERILSRFAAGQADVLIGTQMIAKGLDLPLVTLVGIISADTALHLPDFRSAERTFQLLTQVAGRAGRSMLGGRAILQTYSPQHYAIQNASRHDFREFYRHELAFRREHAYPPFAPLVKLLYSDVSPRDAEAQATRMAQRLRQRCAQLGLPATEVIGPAPAFFGKLRGKYRWQLLVRGAHARPLVRETLPGLGWEVDVDPLSVL